MTVSCWGSPFFFSGPEQLVVRDSCGLLFLGDRRTDGRGWVVRRWNVHLRHPPCTFLTGQLVGEKPPLSAAQVFRNLLKEKGETLGHACGGGVGREAAPIRKQECSVCFLSYRPVVFFVGIDRCGCVRACDGPPAFVLLAGVKAVPRASARGFFCVVLMPSLPRWFFAISAGTFFWLTNYHAGKAFRAPRRF